MRTVQRSTSEIHETSLDARHFDIAPPGSADLVLTFRNLHNWMRGGYAEQAQDGYVREDYAIALAKKAGFVLDGSSEINANPKDTKDWVGGMWTLPPTLSRGDKDRAKYMAVGEADNFVLRFRKPKP